MSVTPAHLSIMALLTLGLSLEHNTWTCLCLGISNASLDERRRAHLSFLLRTAYIALGQCSALKSGEGCTIAFKSRPVEEALTLVRHIVIWGFCGKQLENYGETRPPPAVPVHVIGTAGSPRPRSGRRPSTTAPK